MSSELRKYLDRVNGGDPDIVESQVCNKCKVKKPIDCYYFDVRYDRRWKICSSCKSQNDSKKIERETNKSLSLDQQRHGQLRQCLGIESNRNCEKEFVSISKWNRLCRSCKKEASYE